MPRSLRSYSHTFLLFAFVDGLKSAFSSKQEWDGHSQSHNRSYTQYRQTAYHLKRSGYIEINDDGKGKKILCLTRKGQMELLLAKAWIPHNTPWDGKWRMVMFDIPKEANSSRDKLRGLLKKAGYFKLQESMYLYPYPLNREAIEYLKKSGLIGYIRIGRLDELDDDTDVLKHFKLTRTARNS